MYTETKHSTDDGAPLLRRKLVILENEPERWEAYLRFQNNRIELLAYRDMLTRESSQIWAKEYQVRHDAYRGAYQTWRSQVWWRRLISTRPEAPVYSEGVRFRAEAVESVMSRFNLLEDFVTELPSIAEFSSVLDFNVWDLSKELNAYTANDELNLIKQLRSALLSSIYNRFVY